MSNYKMLHVRQIDYKSAIGMSPIFLVIPNICVNNTFNIILFYFQHGQWSISIVGESPCKLLTCILLSGRASKPTSSMEGCTNIVKSKESTEFTISKKAVHKYQIHYKMVHIRQIDYKSAMGMSPIFLVRPTSIILSIFSDWWQSISNI